MNSGITMVDFHICNQCVSGAQFNFKYCIWVDQHSIRKTLVRSIQIRLSNLQSSLSTNPVDWTSSISEVRREMNEGYIAVSTMARCILSALGTPVT